MPAIFKRPAGPQVYFNVKVIILIIQFEEIKISLNLVSCNNIIIYKIQVNVCSKTIHEEI